MKTDDSFSKVEKTTIERIEQTVIERMVYIGASEDFIKDTRINIWKDVISKDIGPLEKWLSNGWRIVNSSTDVSTFDLGAAMKQTIHTTLVLERKILEKF